MIYWWRRSLAAQLIGFTLFALVVSQALTFMISWDERTKALHAAMKGEFFSRCASMTRLMESMPEPLREQALLASETSYSRFWLSKEEPIDANAWRGRAATEDMQLAIELSQIATLRRVLEAFCARHDLTFSDRPAIAAARELMRFADEGENDPGILERRLDEVMRASNQSPAPRAVPFNRASAPRY